MRRARSRSRSVPGRRGRSRAQRRGDLGGPSPSRRGVRVQSEAASEPDHVRVERHDHCAGEIDGHAPRSTASRRTIHRRNRLSRLQPLPADGPLVKVADPGARRMRRPYAKRRSSASARREKLSSAAPIQSRPDRSPRERTPRSIPTVRSSASAAPAARRYRHPASSDAPSPVLRGAALSDRTSARTRPAQVPSPQPACRPCSARSARVRTPAPPRRSRRLPGPRASSNAERSAQDPGRHLPGCSLRRGVGAAARVLVFFQPRVTRIYTDKNNPLKKPTF